MINNQIQIDKEIYSKMEKLIYTLIDEELSKIRKELIHQKEYDMKWDRYISTDTVKINIEITTKLMEISESCANVDDNEYHECIENIIDEVNCEYALYNYIKISTKDYEITTYSIECDGDYCDIGGGLDIVINSVDYAFVSHFMHYVKDIITLFIEL